MLKNVDTLEREQGNTLTAPMSQTLTQAPFRIEGIENINEVNSLFLQYSKFLLNVETLEREQGNTLTAPMSLFSRILQYSKFLLKNVDTLEREQGNTLTAPMSQTLTQHPLESKGSKILMRLIHFFCNILNFC